jgi:putative hydrolase of the HAD superfamily
MKKIKIKAILFDLGKVVLDFNFEPAFHRLARFTPLDVASIKGYFDRSGLEVLYDGGKISSFEFHKEVKKVLKHTLTYGQFKSIWNNIFTLKKETASLIRRLGPDYRLVLISNTNQMHYEYVRKKFSVLNHFDHCILSFKERIRKPDKKIYQTAAKACRAKAHEIFYIDDREDLTDAAKALGFHTFTFRNNPKELIRQMKGLNII